MVSKIGWDELLKTRSVVFVMEEEYRLHKTNASEDLNGYAHDDASSSGPNSPSDQPTPNTPSDIPTIRISSESTRVPNGNRNGKHDVEVPGLEKPETAQANDESGSPLTMQSGAEGEEVTSAFSNQRLSERWLGE